MKRILITVALSTILLSAQKKESPEALLGAAIHQEEAEGNLEGAIAGYKKILAKYGANHTLAAKAQFRLGACYERLGNAEARKAYERILRHYSDQTELVAQARVRLAALERAHAPGGIVVRQVWAEPGGDLMGAVSLDGSYLTATDWKTGDLSIRDLATGQMRHVTSNKSLADGDAEYSVPSPDGKRIAYGWCGQKRCDLRIINIDGSGGRVLYSDPKVRYVELSAWSPDGKHVLGVLQKDNHRTNEMVLIAVSDGSVRVLKTMGFPHFDDMRFSPDGRYILYSVPQQQNSRERDVFIMAADGSYDAPVVAHPADDRVLGWTPDGRHALFASDRTGGTSAWRIRVVDGKPQGTPELLKKDLGAVTSMGITRRGSLYYALKVSTRDVYTAEINPETGAMITPPAPVAKRFTGANSRPLWSQDGELLAYQALRAGVDDNPVVVIHEVKTGRERVLTPQLSNLLLSSWLPDGSGLIVRTGMDPAPARAIFQKIDAKTGEVSAAQGPNLLSPDGKWSFRWNAGAMHARNLATGEDKVLYSVNADNCCFYGVQSSPDSTRLAVAINSKVVVIPVPTGESREIVTLGNGETFTAQLPGAAIGWLGNHHLLFTRVKGASGEFWRVPAGGGPAQKVDLSMQEVGELHVHPDGRRIAFTAGNQKKSEVWVLENFLTRSAQ